MVKLDWMSVDSVLWTDVIMSAIITQLMGSCVLFTLQLLTAENITEASQSKFQRDNTR